MPSLTQQFNNLLKPLSLEIKHGFQNQSVVRGLDKYMERTLGEILARMGKGESENTGLLRKLRAGFSNYQNLSVKDREALILDGIKILSEIKNITIFDLVENAKESLDHAIEHYTNSSPSLPSDLKRVLLDITHVVELLLKERLSRINPSLIWKNVDQFPDERSETVSPDFAFKRLVKIGGLQLTENIKNVIEDATELRNRIIHFKFRLEEKEARVLIAKLLSFILDFSKNNLSLNWEEEFKQSPKWRLLMADRDLWIIHKPLIEKRMVDEKKAAYYCPSCSAKTFDLGNGCCELCGHTEEVAQCDGCKKKFPVSYLTDVDGGEEHGPLSICGRCYGVDEEYLYPED